MAGGWTKAHDNVGVTALGDDECVAFRAAPFDLGGHLLGGERGPVTRALLPQLRWFIGLRSTSLRRTPGWGLPTKFFLYGVRKLLLALAWSQSTLTGMDIRVFNSSLRTPMEHP